MQIVQSVLVLLCALAGGGAAAYIAWTHRLKHVFPKRGEIKIVNSAGLMPGIAEVLFQTRVLANRPVAGFMHMLIFYGFVAFGAKSATHFLNGLLGLPAPIHLPVLDEALVVFSALVLIACAYMAVRRLTTMKDVLTHMGESFLVLTLISGLMVTYLLEYFLFDDLTTIGGKVVWWAHFLILCTFPSLVAYGKHFHLILGPVNVVLRHMVEVPSDRPIPGNDLDMGDDDTPEEQFEAELARVGMPNGVQDFSFHALLDAHACIECGRCNDACPSAGAGLRPRDHFVLSMRSPTTTGEQLLELAPPDIVATCTQCRACDTVCPVGNRPARTGLELRSRLTAEGQYPPRPMKEGGNDPVEATGNIFGLDADVRQTFIEENELPIYDPAEHEVLLILGCQGGLSPDAQPVAVATARLLEAAGVTYGVLPEEQCWGEGVVHGGGLMEAWPIYKTIQHEVLGEMMGGDHAKTVLTICPHCKDSIKTQYAHMENPFTNVVSHIAYLRDLVKGGKLKVSKKAETMATHHPCKTIHNDEQGVFDELMAAAGVTGKTAGNSPAIPRCCGGGGGGFLWDSPAKVNKNRFQQIMAETQQKKIATGCPGCHRMLNAARDEGVEIVDIATILHERLEGGSAGAGAAEEAEAPAR
jgi:Fe-S oxidoreductase